MPSVVYEEVARLEIELYDSRMTNLHVVTAVLVGAGVAGLTLWYWGRIGQLVYTGGVEIAVSSAVMVAVGIGYYVVRYRQAQRALD